MSVRSKQRWSNNVEESDTGMLKFDNRFLLLTERNEGQNRMARREEGRRGTGPQRLFAQAQISNQRTRE